MPAIRSNQCRSLRDVIFREVASNLLIHREYASGVPARLIIEYGKVTTFNANRPNGFGVLNPENFTPYPKNPVLGAFFREIDRADELGSGMRKMMMYGKRYGGKDPQLIEGDLFRMIIQVPEFGEDPAAIHGTGQVAPEVAPEVTPEVTPEVQRMLAVLHGEMARGELMAHLGLKDEKHFREHYQQAGIASGVIEMTIPDKPRSRLQKYRLTEKGKAFLSAKGR
ncbi:MAG: Fic family protein [Thermodesulfobacteriota bacterium]